MPAICPVAVVIATSYRQTMRNAMILAAVVATVAVPVGSRPTNSDPLVGTWRLVSYVDTPAAGPPIYAFGEHPIGQFMFSTDGRVSVSIMRDPPGTDAGIVTKDIDPDSCIPEWYCSYFGTYRLDGNHRGWTVHVLGGNIPSFIGTNQHRAFRVTGRRLVISDVYSADGQQVRAERILEKI